MLATCCAVLWLVAAGCGEPTRPTHTGLVGGRVLVAPGAGLAGARVIVDQVNLYDGKAELRRHVGETVTNGEGYFSALPTGTINGLILIDASGGTFTDPITGARIQLDPSVHLKALHWLGIFEDRSQTMYVTPIHTLVEARFRYKMSLLGDTTQAANDAYTHLDAHFGNLDWEKVIPADLGQPVLSPTDEVRAAFVLGGLAVLTEDIRTESRSSPQVVNLMTLVDATRRDLVDQHFDGNDQNDGDPGSGLQVGDCPPLAACTEPASGCSIRTCHTLCDLYANTYRYRTADAIAKFIGHDKQHPNTWNLTTLGSDDARALTDSVTRDLDHDLFGDACAEPQHQLPPTIVWEMAPPEGALQGGQITLRVHAIDSDSNKLPTVAFQDYADTDGDPTNDFATVTIDTRAATRGVDGPLTVTAVARNLAGVTSTSTRTFQIDNTAPSVTLDSAGLYVDAANVWWSATPNPMLHGTVTGLSQGRVQVVVGGNVVATAEVHGTEWSAQLPAGALSGTGNDVTIVAADQAGNVATTVQTIRLDTTPPSLIVEQSLVYDEASSAFRFEINAPGFTGSYATHVLDTTHPPIDLSVTGTCPAVHKHSHLLWAPQANQVTHSVLGSAGSLNPLLVNVFIPDDGVGIQPGSAQYRVLRNNGAMLDELMPWTAMPAPINSHYQVPLYRDAIPQLGTTNGEYHLQLRVTDPFGRTSREERCWDHHILAPPLNFVAGSGEPASGFQRALFSTKLNPGPSETGDFSAKFLSANPSGAALWRTRFQNWLGAPVYVTVQLPQGINATVQREFRIMNSLTNFQFLPIPSPLRCGRSHCVSNPPPASIVEYISNFNAPIVQTGIKFRARLFAMTGNETGSEMALCGTDMSNLTDPCIVVVDDVSQTYTFLVPKRTVPQGQPLPEYAFLIYLRPEFPAGNGTAVVMAPSDVSHPDNDLAPYTEFSFLGTSAATLTGKLMGGLSDPFCIEEDVDESGFLCIVTASRQRYRALTRVTYTLSDNVTFLYRLSATLATAFEEARTAELLSTQVWSTDEVLLP